MSRRLLTVGLGFCWLLAAPGEPSQSTSSPAPTATPAHVAAVDGTAWLVRGGQSQSVVENLPLLEGDTVRTGSGRLEVLLPDGSVLDLDRDTQVDLAPGGTLRLSGGRIVFAVSSRSEDRGRLVYQVEARAGLARLSTAGVYRLSTYASRDREDLELAVVSGEATLGVAGRVATVHAGERVVAREDLGLTPVEAYEPARRDAFFEWVDASDDERSGTESQAYLPSNLQTYGGSFDRDGVWERDGSAGWVWYPRVAVDWRPYYDGSWEPYDWGWTWVGRGRWVWPTHHYGRWGMSARGWYWVPGARWSPAWVAWGLASDLVSWCALGIDDRPVFSLFGVAGGARLDPWRAWVAVPRGAFRGALRVPSIALSGHHLRGVPVAGFAVARTGPAFTERAVPRAWSDPGAFVVGNRPSRAASPTDTARPSVQERRWTTEAGSPYARAEAVARGRQDRTGGSDTARTVRPDVTERRWSLDPESPYARAEAAARARDRSLPRDVDTRPFASPRTAAPPYPDRDRNTPERTAPRNPAGRAPGAVVRDRQGVARGEAPRRPAADAGARVPSAGRAPAARPSTPAPASRSVARSPSRGSSGGGRTSGGSSSAGRGGARRR